MLPKFQQSVIYLCSHPLITHGTCLDALPCHIPVVGIDREGKCGGDVGLVPYGEPCIDGCCGYTVASLGCFLDEKS